VYSMSVDGPVRVDLTATPVGESSTEQTGFIAGSKALDALEKLFTSLESFYHPSNSGQWTSNVSNCYTLDHCELTPISLLLFWPDWPQHSASVGKKKSIQIAKFLWYRITHFCIFSGPESAF
jgi:hypothetical protein